MRRRSIIPPPLLSAASTPCLHQQQRKECRCASCVRQELHEHLLHLDAPRFERLIAQLLPSLGYADIEVLRRASHGRISRKGRNRHGGMDLKAFTQTGLSRALTVVQVKQYLRPVSRQFVDSLRGAMLRMEAREGLLITTSTFSRVARQAAASDHIAPIRLVGGRELLDLLFAHQIAVHEKRPGWWQLDRHFLPQLQTHRAAKVQRSWPPVAALRSQRIHKPNAASFGECGTTIEGGGMTWSTHVFAGLGALWLLEPVPGGITPDTIGAVVAAAAFGALLPDLDAADSKIKVRHEAR